MKSSWCLEQFVDQWLGLHYGWFSRELSPVVLAEDVHQLSFHSNLHIYYQISSDMIVSCDEALWHVLNTYTHIKQVYGSVCCSCTINHKRHCSLQHLDWSLQEAWSAGFLRGSLVKRMVRAAWISQRRRHPRTPRCSSRQPLDLLLAADPDGHRT